MSLKAPKAGLAAQMREWMSSQKQPFTMAMLCDSLVIFGRKNRQQIFSARKDFLERGEILRTGKKRNRRQVVMYYRYNSVWKPSYAVRGKLLPNILKAIYVSGPFAVSDIVRLSEAPERQYAGQIVRRLAKAGYLRGVGRRRCADSNSVEALWIVNDRDRFRLEVMR
jgi:hypothetical protein